jgi:hypothetical protein
MRIRMTRLVQIKRGKERRVAVVEEPHLRLLREFNSVFALAQNAIVSETPVPKLTQTLVMNDSLDYESVYGGKSDWRLLAPIDHPDEPARCLVSGTGLTHLGSAKNRNAMHEANEAELTDSMKMFRWGVEGGKPAPGKTGVAPEWFYKGNGTILRAHGEPLVIPSYGEDGGEEAEIAGIYLVGADGQPRRIGMAIGNEFSDHKFEKRNYLNLAGSKIRTCALGPELVIDPGFKSVPGKVSIERAGKILWSKDICSGEVEMCHSLENIEHHHFKFETHRCPGDVHVHYFGACALSFGDGIQLAHQDVMVASFEGFGRPLRNPLCVEKKTDTLVRIQSLA